MSRLVSERTIRTVREDPGNPPRIERIVVRGNPEFVSERLSEIRRDPVHGIIIREERPIVTERVIVRGDPTILDRRDRFLEDPFVTKTANSSKRTSVNRSTNGNISINETSTDGKFIVLENTSYSKDEDISGWKLKRKIDGSQEIVFTFPRDYVLKPRRQVKIWARGQGGRYLPPDELVDYDNNTFGEGNYVQTILYNREEEERASHTQRTT